MCGSLSGRLSPSLCLAELISTHASSDDFSHALGSTTTPVPCVFSSACSTRHDLSCFPGFPGIQLTCCSSVAQSGQTLCDPMDCSTPGFPVLHHLLELAQTHVHRAGDATHPSLPLCSVSPHPCLPQPHLHKGRVWPVASSAASQGSALASAASLLQQATTGLAVRACIRLRLWRPGASLAESQGVVRPAFPVEGPEGNGSWPPAASRGACILGSWPMRLLPKQHVASFLSDLCFCCSGPSSDSDPLLSLSSGPLP